MEEWPYSNTFLIVNLSVYTLLAIIYSFVSGEWSWLGAVVGVLLVWGAVIYAIISGIFSWLDLEKITRLIITVVICELIFLIFPLFLPIQDQYSICTITAIVPNVCGLVFSFPIMFVQNLKIEKQEQERQRHEQEYQRLQQEERRCNEEHRWENDTEQKIENLFR